MKKINKNLIIAISVVVIIIAAVLIYFLFVKKATISTYSVDVKNGDITEKISLNGQVKASQGVDLSFEGSGKIVANYVKVGDKIYTGQPLVAIDSSLLQAQLEQAQAQLSALDINTVQSKTDVSLQSLYANSLSSAKKSVDTAKDTLLTISDMQFSHFNSQIPENIALQNSKAQAVNSLLGQPDAGTWTTQLIAQLNGGAYGLVQTAINNPTQANIDAALAATQSALQDVNSMINAVPINSSLSTTERSSLTLLKTGINAEIMTTSANRQAIASAKVNNSATITTTNDQIRAAQANIDAIRTQISKTVLKALFNGQVDKDNVVVGQLVSPGVPIVTISNSNLEIDTNIPEVDLSVAKVGSAADITLDAFGNNVIFPATIVSIDSAPSTVGGVSVYGARLKFNNADDRIKSGMTANINVISETHKNVLLVPKSAVITKNGQTFVLINKGNSQNEVRQVTVGLRNDDNIEIISGLKLGEKVLAY